jgi:uncharacterized protein YmfQ (DUF2313 family)
MGYLPEVFGGAGGVGAEDYVRQYQQALLGALGRGLYNPDLDDGPHARYLRTSATILARMRARMDTLFGEAIPSRSYYALAAWEWCLGLDPVPSEEWTIERRRDRIQARLWERRGNNPVLLKIAFEKLTGRTCYVHCPRVDVAHGVPALAADESRFYVTVLVPQAVYDDKVLWAECLKMARRRQSARGLISVAVTADTAYPTQPENRFGASLFGRDTFGRNALGIT